MTSHASGQNIQAGIKGMGGKDNGSKRPSYRGLLYFRYFPLRARVSRIKPSLSQLFRSCPIAYFVQIAKVKLLCPELGGTCAWTLSNLAAYPIAIRR